MAVTRALIQRHAGRAAYDAALLDVAQDHLLYAIQSAGLFARPGLVFKGGTSLRKCRLGSAGRFSTYTVRVTRILGAADNREPAASVGRTSQRAAEVTRPGPS